MILEDEKDQSRWQGTSEGLHGVLATVEAEMLIAFKAGRDDEANRLRQLWKEFHSRAVEADLAVEAYAKQRLLEAQRGAKSRLKPS